MPDTKPPEIYPLEAILKVVAGSTQQLVSQNRERTQVRQAEIQDFLHSLNQRPIRDPAHFATILDSTTLGERIKPSLLATVEHFTSGEVRMSPNSAKKTIKGAGVVTAIGMIIGGIGLTLPAAHDTSAVVRPEKEGGDRTGTAAFTETVREEKNGPAQFLEALKRSPEILTPETEAQLKEIAASATNTNGRVLLVLSALITAAGIGGMAYGAHQTPRLQKRAVKEIVEAFNAANAQRETPILMGRL